MSDQEKPLQIDNTVPLLSPAGYINAGYDPKEWVMQVVLPRIKRDPDTRAYIFPDPLIDLEHFAQLHSWYKHLRIPMRFYPILRIGQEPRNSMDADSDSVDEKEEELHWAFIDEHTLYNNEYNGYYYKMVPFAIMNNHYFYLNKYLDRYTREKTTDQALNTINRITTQTVILECMRIQDRITRILLELDPNPPDPEHTTLISDYENPSDSVEVSIAGKIYKLECISIDKGAPPL